MERYLKNHKLIQFGGEKIGGDFTLSQTQTGTESFDSKDRGFPKRNKIMRP